MSVCVSVREIYKGIGLISEVKGKSGVIKQKKNNM